MAPELASLIAAAVMWVFVHIGIAGTRLRDRCVRVLGERGFRGAFSVLSVANIVWLGLAYAAAGPVRVLWQAPGWLAVLCILLLAPASILLVGSLTVLNPTSVAGVHALLSKAPAIGILRVTRYPMLWSFATMARGERMSHHQRVAILEAMADDVVWNGGEMRNLDAQCERLHRFYCTIPPKLRRDP